MSTLYLHIGTPKTGTTAIQVFLMNNRELLKSKGFFFPIISGRFGRIIPNTGMLEKVSSRRNAHFLIDFLDRKDADNEEYVQMIRKCYDELFEALDNNDNVILTDESIWHACKKIKNFWKDLLSKLNEKGHDLKVIVYLRRQDEFIQSYWKFNVLASETMSFKEYVNSSKYKFFPLDYYTHLSNISKDVGKDNVIVRVYEKGQYKGKKNNIISDFFDALGLELTDEYTESDSVKNANVDYICTEVKRKLNIIPEFKSRRIFLRRIMNEISEQNCEEEKFQFNSIFAPEDQKCFLEKYEEENRKVAIEFLNRQDGRLFYAPVLYDEQPKEFSSNELVYICGKMLLELNEENNNLIQEKNDLIRENKRIETEFNGYKKHSLIRIFISRLIPERIRQTDVFCNIRNKFDRKFN